MIIGNGCSGKSVLAERLGKILSVEVTHLDHFYWQGNNRININEWQQLHNSLIQKDTWIIEGTQLRELDQRIAAADLILFLNTNLLICILRAIKKYLKRDADYGFPLQKKWFSIIYWLIKFNFVYKPWLFQKLKSNVKSVVLLDNKREIAYFLEIITLLANK